ncbi:hypothetical protein ACH5RR_005418 [Cinchona calisaya]|uniref:PWWP domain-containing protein n=1 Tax=Cinchona calisaya TaxID=153742 RepID=A0ABD3AL64_9GENT
MSLKLNGIDLNSEAVWVEANETPMGSNTGDPRGVGGFSVDGARVLGELNDSSNTGALVEEVSKAEMEGVNSDGSLQVGIESNTNRGSEEGFIGQENTTTDSKRDVEIKGINNVEVDENQEMGEFPQNHKKGDEISIFVDLNSRHPDENCNEGAEGTEAFIEVNLPISVALAGNMDASINDGGFTGNRYALIKEVVTSGQANEVDENDYKPGALKPKSRGTENQTEKEGEFYVSDLVWGKVRSHPWWPGQIIEPSAASEKALKYFKKDSYLIAYFGDQTFAWNEASKIKPFKMYFSQMKKQSNVEAFCHAVDGALVEVSRRVEFGLACQCLPEEVSSKVKYHVVVNAGILVESTSICGGDSFSTADSFIPAKLVNFLEALAESPHSDVDILEFTIARAQLLAFNRWKGYYQLPVLEELNGVLGNDPDLPVLSWEKNLDEVIEDDLDSKEDDQIASAEVKSPSNGSSRMHGHLSVSNESKGKKKRLLLELMSGSSSSFPNGDNDYKGTASSEKASESSRKKRKAVDSVSTKSRKKSKGISTQRAGNTNSLLRNCNKIGEQVHGAAGKTGVGVPPLRSHRRSSQRAIVNHGGISVKTSCSGDSILTAEKSRSTPQDYRPTSEIFSKLCAAAESPMGYSSLSSVAGFFCGFRNSICLEYHNHNRKMKLSGKQELEKSSELETTEAFEFVGMEDSYWTDRIIQSNLDEQILFEPDSPAEKDVAAAAAEQEGLDGTNLDVDSRHEMNPVVTELEMEENSNEYSPTSMILNFTDLESVPSITNLNNIFKRYGPLEELQTKILSKSKRAKVVFKRRSDAETAFSSAGKFSIFGPSLVSYRLKYTPPPPRKASSASKTKRRRKNTSVEDCAT